MLDSLDTLIAFVLIMLVVSLLITIAVQIVSSLLRRGDVRCYSRSHDPCPRSSAGTVS
jgi:hypothetical protein